MNIPHVWVLSMPDKQAWAQQSWVDIIAPAMPANSDAWQFFIAIGGLLVLGGCLYVYSRPVIRARWRLFLLSRKISPSTKDLRSVCLEIVHCLRSVYRTNMLRELHFSNQPQSEWLGFINRLDSYCFSHQQPSAQQTSKLIKEATDWLRNVHK